MSTRAIFNEDPADQGESISQQNAVLALDVQLRSLLQYIENSRAILNEIETDFSLSQAHSGDSIILQRAAKRLAGFCMDADRWGFDTMYKIAFGLQELIEKSLARAKNNCFWETLNRGISLLSSMVNRCEYDYRQRLAVADVLDSFDRAAYN